MPEPVEVVTDAFGAPVPTPDGEHEDKKPEDEKDEGDNGGKGEDDKGGDDKGKKEPTVAELSKRLGELEALNGTKDENIKAMREKIKSLEKGKGGEKGAEGDKEETMFPNIVFSKDLPKDKLEEMTDTEIKLFDEGASLKVAMNKMFDAIKAGKDTSAVDLNATARAEALRLAGNDTKIANQIIEQFNEFNNAGLTQEQIIERVAKASKLVPDYKPPKEQEKKDGAPVKKKGGADPYGVDAIVKEARKGSSGGYSL